MPHSNNKILYLLFIALLSLFPFIKTGAQEDQAIKLKTVVIDPGHGGKHPGAISADRKVKEKDLTLSISLKLGELIKQNHPDVKVIYTRTTDKYVDLIDRTKLANQSHADLFISIHINAAKSKLASGTETFVMGNDKASANFDVVSRENSVIEIEDDYTSKYQGFDPNDPASYIVFSLLQNSHLDHSLMFASLVQEKLGNSPFKVNRGVKQGGLWVLWQCTMPAVLIELGFISNTSDYKILAEKTNHNTIANHIYDAFKEYKIAYEKGLDPHNNITTPTITSKEENNSPAAGEYRVQIFVTSSVLDKNDPNLKNLSNYQYLKVGKLYKYSVGPYVSYEEAANALKSLKKRYVDAFIISSE